MLLRVNTNAIQIAQQISHCFDRSRLCPAFEIGRKCRKMSPLSAPSKQMHSDPSRNICFTLPGGMELGGVTTWSIEMASALSTEVREVSLVDHVMPDCSWSESIPRNVRLLRHFGTRPVLATQSDTLLYAQTYLKAMPCTLIPNYTAGTYAACAEIAKKSPEQFRLLGFAHTDQPHYYDLLTFYEPIIHRFVAVSDEIAATLAQRLPDRQDDIVVRPYGIKVPADPDRTYSDQSRPLQLVYAGRLVESQKRVSDLVRLTAALTKRGVNFRLQIAGCGPARAALEESFRTLGSRVASHVEFIGRVPTEKMRALWQFADVCILVSEFEGTSISMLEAMAEGCVPVVTRVSGTKAVIDAGMSGFVCDVGDTDEMANILKSLDNDRDLLRNVGRNAHRVVFEQFAFSSYVDWFAGTIAEVWNEAPRHWPRERSNNLFPAWHSRNLSLLARTRRLTSGSIRKILSLPKQIFEISDDWWQTRRAG